MQSYRIHFGLEADPFRMVPDPDFLFWSTTHEAAVTALGVALEAGTSAVILIGAPGTGKSTVLRHVVSDDEPSILTGHVWHPTLLQEGFYRTVLSAFGMSADTGEDDENEHKLARHLRKQKSLGNLSVLLIDEAQTLSTETLERVLLLAHDHEGLSVVLVGQPALHDTVSTAANRPDGPSIRLSNLKRDETVKYVRHRISQAGGGIAIFTDSAFDEIHRRSGGVPRLINSLCERSLYYAATNSAKRIDANVIALADMEAGGGNFLESAQVTETPARRLRVVESDALQADVLQDLRLVSEHPALGGESKLSADHVDGGPFAPDDPTPILSISLASTPVSASPFDKSDLTRETIRGSESGPKKQDAREQRHPRSLLMAFAGGLAAGLILSVIGLSAFWKTQTDSTESLTTAIAELPAATPVDPERSEALRKFSLSIPTDPESRFRHAVSLAGENPELAVMAYSHAAILGHPRAAYYLGQIFETGDGVPVDIALARAWYEIAADEVRGAKASLASLPASRKGPLAPPVPLLGRKTSDGFTELSWVSGGGSGPAAFTVEFAAEASPETLWSKTLRRSAARVLTPVGASRWRVVATEDDSVEWLPSSWQLLIDP